MNDNNIYKKIRIIFLFLAIVCMLFTLFKKVHAAVPDDYISIIDDKFQTANNYSDALTYLNWAYNNHVTYIAFEDENYLLVLTYAFEEFGYGLTSINKSDIDNYTLDDFKTVDVRCGALSNDYTFWCCPTSHSYAECPNINVGSYSGDECPFMMILLDKTLNNLSVNYYKSYNISSGTNTYCYDYSDGSIVYDANKSQSAAYGSYSSNNVRVCVGQKIIYNYSIFDNSFSHTFNNIYTCGKVAMPFRSGNSGTVASFYHVLYIDKAYENPNTSDTPNFNVFVYNEDDVDYVRFVAPKNLVPVGTHSSNLSTLSFTLYKDELSPVDFSFDSDSVYYYESLDYGRAYYQIPFSILVDNLSEYETVYLNNVIYYNEWSNQGGEYGSDTFYKYSDTFLKQTNFVPTPPDDTIPSTIDDGEITAAENQNIDTIYDKKSGIDNRPYFFISADAEWNFNYDIYTYYFIEDDNNTSSENQTFLERLWETINTVTNLNYNWDFLYRVIHGKDFEWETIPVEPQEDYDAKLKKFQNKANELMENNAFTQSFDIIIFACYFKNPPDEAHRYAYITVFTDRYKSTVNNYMLRKIYNKMADEMKQMSDIYSMLDTRLNNLDSNFYGWVSSYNSNSGKLFRLLNTLNGRFSNLSDNLMGILNRIFDALGDLELSQLDAIDSKLSTIINNLPISSGDDNEIDTVKECIEYYKENTNSNGLPTLSVYQNDMFHSWFTGKVHDYLDNDNSNIQQQRNNILVSIFDTLTAGYDSIFDLSGAGDYIGEFIDYISGNGDHNNSRSNYMTHFFSDSYDVNTYSGWVSGDE